MRKTPTCSMPTRAMEKRCVEEGENGEEGVCVRHVRWMCTSVCGVYLYDVYVHACVSIHCMCACVCLYVHACVSICVRVSVCACMCPYVCVCLYVHACVSVCACMCVCLYVHLCNGRQVGR